MNIEIEEEYQEFLNDYYDGNLVFGKYLDEFDYEDEYSHNDIDDAQNDFVDKVKAFLHENASGKYIVSSGYCVFVMTPDRARESKLSETTIEECLVL